MKTILVNKNSICTNFNRNYRYAIGIFVVFIVIGVLVGAYQAKTYEPHRIVVNVDINKPISMSDYPAGESQIYDIYNDIKTNADQIEVYYRYLLQINTSEESRVKIEDAADVYHEFYNKDLKEFEDNYKYNPAAAKGFENETALYYEKEAEKQSWLAKTEQERLEDVMEGTYVSDFKYSFQRRAELSISRQKLLAKTFARLSNELKTFSNEQIAENTDMFYEQADSAAEYVNEAGNSLDQLLEEISKKENYELIYNSYLMPDAAFGDINEERLSDRLGDAVVYAKSIEGTDTRKERFWASILFFMMAGAAISILYGALYENKTKRNHK